MRRIRVARFGEPDVLELVADPPASAPVGAGRVRVAIEAAGVNPADTYIRAGTYEFLAPELPYTPGFDAAGIIVDVGAGVTDRHVGERVWVSLLPARITGAYADTLDCDAALVHPLPSHLSFAQGAAIGVPAITAYRALIQRGQARTGETVLIHGASGGVGLPAVQIAVARSMTVIGTASTPEGRRIVRAAGAHHVIDHSDPAHLELVGRLTGGRGADVVIEMRADLNLGTVLRVLAPNGRVVIVGARGQVTIAPRELMAAEADIRGTALWNMSAADADDAYSAVQDMLERGQLRPVVGGLFALEHAADAHRTEPTGRAGKLVLMARLHPDRNTGAE
ncbi:NADPH:quinone reductase [Microbacterium sp. MYb64]|uniref:NADPH:quinone reductase n=1 Tax=Microbacterium sp. MYb64 TaxID=1848691 RepID=UPI000CFCB88C|nr:NADPH:quinone reductase [Microbacterium sp. MYb64]PRB00975.1 quinone oxidoreductase [Microbacterium sp. MYb64]